MMIQIKSEIKEKLQQTPEKYRTYKTTMKGCMLQILTTQKKWRSSQKQTTCQTESERPGNSEYIISLVRKLKLPFGGNQKPPKNKSPGPNGFTGKFY